jgi:hypothetical protein
MGLLYAFYQEAPATLGVTRAQAFADYDDLFSVTIASALP